MFLNIALFFLIFVAAKKKFSALGGSVLLGAIKGAVYYFTSKNVPLSAGMFVGTALLSFLLVTLISRLDQPGAEGQKQAGFRWEYLAIAVVAFFFLVGEFVFGLRAFALTH